LAETIERFGARFVTDTCVLNSPVLPAVDGVLMTSSAKYAHYAPGILGRDVVFGSTEDCVRSAVAGRPVVQTPAWLAA
jgi:predicted aconitase